MEEDTRSLDYGSHAGIGKSLRAARSLICYLEIQEYKFVFGLPLLCYKLDEGIQDDHHFLFFLGRSHTP